jgi:hypothetical protein
MNDQSRGGIYVVNPETGEAEAITSKELAARQALAPEPVPEPVAPKPVARKPPEELTNATQK